ncbi:MAG: threonine--tRNA ligase [Nitrososphaerota archaeon]|nr:threonine--tRNA ligase [Nitrososphaerota archaeon]MDG6923262.1 threonine--tRNA ligase [Nitrososphaerota archaeon]
MRALQLHCDELEYKPIKKEISSAEDASTNTVKITDAVALLISVEKEDDASVANQVVEAMKKAEAQLKCRSFVIYPYAHLSSSLASPEQARDVLSKIEQGGKDASYTIHHVPFGWNKAFSVRVKGHPLAEQSKVFKKESEQRPSEQKELVSAALKAEDTLRSQWFVIDLEGNLTPFSEFNYSRFKNLEKLKNYETAKVRAVQQIPPHVNLMKRLGLVDYEPASDPGNMRYYPKGRLVKSLLERFVTQKVQEYGGVEVETPIMYDMEHPALKSYLNRFPARQYLVKSDDKEFFLRFAACFGQFLIAKDLQLTYKQLPLKIYELTRYSFRREKSGELVGLRRLRAFTMPDCHAIVRDLNQAKEEFSKRFELSQEVLKEIGFERNDYELAIRFTEEFYKENKEFIASIIKLHGRPALVEMWKERFFYFVLKWEFNFIDNLDKASALSTDQIDIENAERYGITYVDEEGKKQTPLILHNSPSGAIERDIYGLLEKAGRSQKEGKVGTLPVWLSPTHLRLIPVSLRFLETCTKISEEFEKERIRVDIDDREESVGKRIRDAEKEWVPYVLVIGDKEEADPSNLTVRVRGLGEKKLARDSLKEEISEKVSGKPFLPVPLPKMISKRPSFELTTAE